ncbi:trypsin delta-like [Anopheles aquasalis]|uniref:trypsin delta-like n=1 Tax=Anopheles aquasalis TaxID=42839 RepID=UPI00215B3558|nr:trypsin delta-like [Anopheles aquasalis]
MKQSVKLILLALMLLCAYCTKAQDGEATDPGSDAESTANFSDENGTNQVQTKRVRRTIGGVQSAIADYPYVVSVILQSGAGTTVYRVGAIISDTHVLTVADGFLYISNGIQSITIRAGSVYKDQGGFTFPVSNYEIHPSYNRATSENNVAVLTIMGTFSGSANVAPITVATSEIPFSAGNPTSCVVLGWGRDKSDTVIIHLNQVVYNLTADSTCMARFGPLDPTYLCAESVSGYICINFIGFPLVCNNQLYGLNPNLGDCETGPRVFVKLPAASIQSFIAPYLPVAASQPPPRKNYVSCP